MSRVTDFVSAASAGAVCLAVVHEWAFFNVVGPDLIRLMTISDLVGSVVVKLPALLIGAYIGGVLVTYARRPGPPAGSPAAPAEPNSDIEWLFTWWSVCGFALIALFGVLASSSWGLLYLPGILLFGKLARGPVQRGLAAGDLLRVTVVGLVPIVFIITWGLGALQGQMATEIERGDYELLLEDGSRANVDIIRSLGNGLIYLDEKTKIVQYASSSQVRGLRARDGFKQRRYLCEWFGLVCA